MSFHCAVALSVSRYRAPARLPEPSAPRAHPGAPTKAKKPFAPAISASAFDVHIQEIHAITDFPK